MINLLTILKTKKTILFFVFLISLTLPFTTFAAEDFTSIAGQKTSRFTGVDTKTGETVDPMFAYTLREHLIKEKRYDEKTAFASSSFFHNKLYDLNLKYEEARNKYQVAGNTPITTDIRYSNIGNSTDAVSTYKDLLVAEQNRLNLYKQILTETGYQGPDTEMTLDSLNDQITTLGVFIENVNKGNVKPGGVVSQDTNVVGAIIGKITGSEQPLLVDVNTDANGNSNQMASRITCDFTSGQGLLGCLAIAVYVGFFKLSALFLWFTGILFNFTLNFTLNIGNLFQETVYGIGGQTGAVYVGWSTIRNLINIFFIFSLLYVAISMIIQSGSYGDKKMITKIVTAALLINFSLFFTKAIIDTSNILALQFYAAIMKSSNEINSQTSNSNSLDGGLSGALLNALNLDTLWTGGGGQKTDPTNSATTADSFASIHKLDAYGLLMISIFGGLFIFIFAFTLFVGVALLLTRTIVLIMLMILSPIGFIGGAVPILGGSAKKWRERLINNAIFAPAYMAVLYLVAQIIFGAAGDGLGRNGNFVTLILNTQGRGTTESTFGILFWFIFVIGLLLAGIGAARNFADGFGKSFSGGVENFLKGKGVGKSGRFNKKEIWDGLKNRTSPVRSLGLRSLRLEGQKARDARLGANLKTAKSKADNLRQRGGESKEQFEVRQAQIVNKVKEKQAQAFGLDTTVDISASDTNQPGHFNVTFIKDASGTVVGYKLGDLNENGKKALKAQKEVARKKFTRRGRNKAADAAKRAEEAFAAPKPGSSGSVEKKRDEIKSKLEKLEKDNGYKIVRTQLETEVSDAKTKAETEAKSGKVTNITYAALKRAQKRYMEHIAEENKHKKELAELEEKLEKVKREEKERDEKEKEKSKKK